MEVIPVAERSRPPTPYGLPILESCMTCVVPESRLFCNLSPAGLSELDRLRRTSSYPENAVLYVEGGHPHALFILCAGKAKLASTGKEGKAVTLREVLPGEVMGLSC